MNPTTQHPELLPAQAVVVREQAMTVATEPTSIAILEAAIKHGVTSENVAVVKEIIAMRREEVALANKASFNRSFFALKKEISTMNFYADKEAKTDSGKVAYSYCSEAEIAGKLEPVLFKHGFAMLFGQRQDADRVVAIITLIHDMGHEETREYSVRVGQSNKMKDSTAVDSGSTTSAWRHLVIKMFGLKSRIRAEDDARNEGGPITQEQSEELQRRVSETGSDVAKFLKFAGDAKSFATIPAIMYPLLDTFLQGREKKGR
jgi:hypothetical protein